MLAATPRRKARLSKERLLGDIIWPAQHRLSRSRTAAAWQYRSALIRARQESGMLRDEFAAATAKQLQLHELSADTIQTWEDDASHVRPPYEVVEAAAQLAGTTVRALLAPDADDEAGNNRLPDTPGTSEALAALAAASTTPTPESVMRGLEGGRVGSDVVSWAAEQVESLSHLDDVVGGSRCLSLTHGDLNIVLALLKRASYDSLTERGLQHAVAELGRLAGWLASDAGFQRLAERYWHQGLVAARAICDHEYASYLLANLGLQASFTGAPLTAIHLLEAARSEVGEPTNLALPALLDAWQVTPYALLGERHDASHRLNLADDLYDRRQPENDPAWLYWMFRPSHNPESGRAFLTLGEPRTAERLLTEGLDQVPADFRRDRQLYLIGIAEARQAQPKRLDEALHAATQALGTSPDLDSPRARERLIEFAHQLPREPTTRDFLDRIRSLTKK
jgi:hypothetical protein